MTTTQIKIQGMTCSGCENNVQIALDELEGVIKADVDRTKGSAIIEHENLEISTIKNAVEEAGYSVQSE
jgi:copper chaperone